MHIFTAERNQKQSGFILGGKARLSDSNSLLGYWRWYIFRGWISNVAYKWQYFF